MPYLVLKHHMLLFNNKKSGFMISCIRDKLSSYHKYSIFFPENEENLSLFSMLHLLQGTVFFVKIDWKLFLTLKK